MSCETRHRTIIANLLTLAGLRGTVDADTVIRIGSGHRSRRGEQRISEPRSVVLNTEVRTAMGIIGHGADTLPAWVPALIALLARGANTNNRRAFLTIRLLTGGWDAVLPLLTDRDWDWLLTAAHIGLSLGAWTEDAIPPSAPFGWAFLYPLNHAVERTTILDALRGIGDVPPVAVRDVTTRQVLRLAVGGQFITRTNLHAVLRAVLAHTPAAAQALRFFPNGIGAVFRLTTVTPSVDPRPAAWMEQGIALVLADVAATLRAANGPALDPTTLRDPSAEVVADVVRVLATQGNNIERHTAALATLMHLWRTDGRDDAVTATIRRLETVLAQDVWLSSTIGAALLAAGAVAPPHGDAVLTKVGIQDYYTTSLAWNALTGAAVYAAMCQRHGHRPTVAGLNNLVRNRWRTRTSFVSPSPIPLLTVGRERELLLPVIHAERDTDRRVGMLLDCIDAMTMLALVGGDADGFRAVLRDAVPSARDPLDPRVVIRLAADRDGQAVLAHLPTVPTPPAWTVETLDNRVHRLIPHLVSPAWVTAPQPLRTWWETTLRHIATSSVASLLDRLDALYPVVAPDVAMVRPMRNVLVSRAIAHPAWATLPETERQESLTRACSLASFKDMLTIVARATTPTAMADIRATLPHAPCLIPDKIHVLQALIDDDLRRTP